MLIPEDKPPGDDFMDLFIVNQFGEFTVGTYENFSPDLEPELNRRNL